MNLAAPIQILFVDDDEDDYIITRDLLAECAGNRFVLDWVPTYYQALAAMAQGRHDLYLVDYQLGERHGLELLQAAVAKGCRAPVIMLTGQGDHAVDLEAMKAGAADFLVKGQLSAVLLERAIRYALERAHTVEALRHSEERYRVLFESNPQPLWVYDQNSLAILTVNAAAIKHYGYGREEFLALTMPDLYPPGQWTEQAQFLSAPLDAEHSPLVCRHQTQSGALIEVEITTYELLFDHRLARLIVAQDITEKLNLEAQLRQSQKMESVGQLAAGVAHDFNNILTVVQGQACLLLTEANLSPIAVESLNQIRVAAERAANLTRQLLTFSRRQIMQLKTVHLNEVIENVAQMLHRLLGEPMELRFELETALPPVCADLGMLEQIIVNLSVNGRDAMADGGRLTIRTRTVDIDATYTHRNPEAKVGRHVCLSVSDTGCGMDEKILARIFEPFFTTKEVGKGTGLGLATVYGIAKQHCGWVEVESRVGVGTTFQVFLPVQTQSISQFPDEPTQVPGRGGTERLLVVEDEPNLRSLVQHILKLRGYQVLTASSGLEALQVWQQEHGQFHLLLTDMVMPYGLSGRQLSLRLLAENPQLKVIYTSGYSMDLVGHDFELRDGCNFLQKPYHPNKLTQAVRQCLDHGQA